MCKVKKSQKKSYGFTLGVIIVDIFNILDMNKHGVLLKRKDITGEYRISKSQYYRLIELLKDIMMIKMTAKEGEGYHIALKEKDIHGK